MTPSCGMDSSRKGLAFFKSRSLPMFSRGSCAKSSILERIRNLARREQYINCVSSRLQEREVAAGGRCPARVPPRCETGKGSRRPAERARHAPELAAYFLQA